MFDFNVGQDGWLFLSGVMACPRAAYGAAARAESPLGINCHSKKEVSRACLEGTVILSVCELYLVWQIYILCVYGGTVNLPRWRRKGYVLQSHIETTLIKRII